MIFIINDILYYLGVLTFVIPVSLIFVKRRILISPLFAYVSLNFISVILAFLFNLHYSNSYPIFHLSVLLTTIVLILYFKKEDSNCPILYQLVLVLIIFSSYIDIFELNGLWSNNFISTLLSNFSLTIMSLRNLYVIFNNDLLTNLLHLESRFYIAISIFVFNSSSFFFSIFENQIRSVENDLFLITFPLFSVFTILHNILLTLGLWKLQKAY